MFNFSPGLVFQLLCCCFLFQRNTCFSCVVCFSSRGSSAKRGGGMERSQSSTWDSGEENRNKLVKAASTSKLLSKVVKNAEKYVFGSFHSLCGHKNHPKRSKKSFIFTSVVKCFRIFESFFLTVEKTQISSELECTSFWTLRRYSKHSMFYLFWVIFFQLPIFSLVRAVQLIFYHGLNSFHEIHPISAHNVQKKSTDSIWALSCVSANNRIDLWHLLFAWQFFMHPYVILYSPKVTQNLRYALFRPGKLKMYVKTLT